MKNEPVAWAYIKDGEFWDAIHPDEHAQEEGSYDIPLYTHPVKEQDESFDRTASHMAGEYVSYKQELTDEEMNDTIQGVIAHAFIVAIDTNSIDAPKLYRDIGRAILRKAGEK